MVLLMDEFLNVRGSSRFSNVFIGSGSDAPAACSVAGLGLRGFGPGFARVCLFAVGRRLAEPVGDPLPADHLRRHRRLGGVRSGFVRETYFAVPKTFCL